MKTNNTVDSKIYLHEQSARIMLEGEVTFKNVASLRDRGVAIIDNLVKVEIDFAKVTHADSSALALVIAWVRDANVQSKTIKYHNLPQKMLDLGRFNGLDAVLPIFKE